MPQAFAKQYTRRCPGCSVLIYRYVGCSHMTCKCGMSFDWESDEAQVP